MDHKDLEQIESLISRRVGTFADAVQHKLDLVVEGHQMLADKMDHMEKRLDGRIDCVIRKLDAVAAQGDATAAKLDTVAAKLDHVAAQGDATAAKLDTVAAKLDHVAAQGDATAAKLDTVAAKLDHVAAQGEVTAAKLDTVAADLKAHRVDTEAHHPLYRIKE